MPANTPPSRKRIVGRPFKKGQTGNPKGHSEVRRALGSLKRITLDEVHSCVSLLLTGTEVDLHSVVADAKAPVMTKMFARACQMGLEDGDLTPLRIILERVLGKPKEAIEVAGKNGGPIDVRAIPVEERLARIEALRIAREAVGND